ncbi:hypothetical protein GCM10022251_37350 [Phytohabitans flavus]
MALGTVLVLSFGLAGPAAAIPTDPSSPCLEQAFGNLKASSTNVAAGAPVALSWDTPKVANCPTLKYELETRLFGETLEANYPIQPNSSKTLSPAVNTLVILNATMGPGAKKPLDSISVAVTRTSADGRMEIVIDSSTDKALFLWAIDQPKTTIRLRDNVNLDLSYRDQLYIAEGVHILGNRGSTNPGPRIYTTTKPKRLFMIGRYLSGDGVRISGIRLDGGETAIADNGDPAPIGIAVHASVNVAIENNEIYGWAGAGVEVSDQIEGRANKLNLDNPSGVLVRDNFIHHNQHKRKFGYGVVVGDDAYATIEQNVFDYNRHAISSDGLPGTGYLAYRNLVLQHGGVNTWATDTHQFDVHGTESCWTIDFYCGDAGQYFDIRYNSFYYTEGDVVKVRGEPHIRANVRDNVFADTNADEAIVQTVDGFNVVRERNRFGLNTFNTSASCDFDGDGTADRFLATGNTWWFLAKTGQWTYLNMSAKQVGDLTFGDLTGDGRCDVRAKANGQVFPGGRASSRSIEVTWRDPAGGDLRLWEVANGVAGPRVVRWSAGDRTPLGTGDFNGDGLPDRVQRGPDGAVYVMLLDAYNGRFTPPGDRSDVQGVLPAGVNLAGIGDFNADGRSDLLWRHPDGALEIWMGGESRNKATLSYLNDPTATTGMDWQVRFLGDFNGDGRSDILWRHDNGSLSIWYMNGELFAGELKTEFADPTAIWDIEAVGDFDADGRADILWRHDDGGLAIWFRGINTMVAYPTWQNRPGHRTELDWRIEAVADVNADRRADIIWQHTNGTVVSWTMDGGRYVSEYATGSLPAGSQLISVAPIKNG